jgi:FkbM family methyltransferase
VLHQEHLFTQLSRLKVNCVIDVGAHFGEFGNYLRVLGYRGRIVSFEPVSKSFSVLAQRATADRDWHTYNRALGANPGRLRIRIAKSSDMSSFLTPTEYCNSDFASEITLEEEDMVEVGTIDACYEDCISGIENPHVFLKTDTQGYDINVLRGAKSCMSKLVGIQAEVSVRPLYEGGTPYLTAIQFMADMGFDLTGLFVVNRDRHLRVIEFDCVVVNRTLCSD